MCLLPLERLLTAFHELSLVRTRGLWPGHSRCARAPHTQSHLPFKSESETTAAAAAQAAVSTSEALDEASKIIDSEGSGPQARARGRQGSKVSLAEAEARPPAQVSATSRRRVTQRARDRLARAMQALGARRARSGTRGRLRCAHGCTAQAASSGGPTRWNPHRAAGSLGTHATKLQADVRSVHAYAVEMERSQERLTDRFTGLSAGAEVRAAPRTQRAPLARADVQLPAAADSVWRR